MRKAARFTLAIAAVMSVMTAASFAQSVLTHHVRDAVTNAVLNRWGK